MNYPDKFFLLRKYLQYLQKNSDLQSKIETRDPIMPFSVGRFLW